MAENTPVSVPEQKNRELIWVEKLTYWMDNGFKVPFLPIRFGLDPIIGLVPILGEMITFMISGMMLLSSVRSGITGKTAFKMFFNIFLDAMIGEIPVIGDIFDFNDG